jgi:hypothetical protein
MTMGFGFRLGSGLSSRTMETGGSPPPSGPALYAEYTFEGSVTNDGIGSNHLTEINGPQTTGTGYGGSGNCIVGDATNGKFLQLVGTPNQINGNAGQEVTWAMWAKQAPSSSGFDVLAAARSDGGNGNFTLWLDGTNLILGARTEPTVSIALPSDAAFHLVVLRYDGANQVQVSVDKGAWSTVNLTTALDAQDLCLLGANGGGWGDGHELDHFRVWNARLSDAEVAAL